MNFELDDYFGQDSNAAFVSSDTSYLSAMFDSANSTFDFNTYEPAHRQIREAYWDSNHPMIQSTRPTNLASASNGINPWMDDPPAQNSMALDKVSWPHFTLATLFYFVEFQ